MPEKRKPKRAKRLKPRDARTDERGIPLTSDQPPFIILPSDLAVAMRQPPDAPTQATCKAEPERPTTAIPELNLIELTPFAYQCVIEAIDAADQVQIEKMNPSGGTNLRYRIEIAAAFLAHVMEHAYDAAVANGGDPKEFTNLALNIAIRRAQEIYGQDGA
jgi:hypothetical protein